MPSESVFANAASHPAPHRHRVPAAALVFGLVAAPTAWTGQLLVNATLAGYACYPFGEPRAALTPGWSWLWPMLLAVDVVTLLVCIAGGIVALWCWRSTREERPGPSHHLIEAGEGRTRFLSMWGLLFSVGFACATVFDMVTLFVVPLCGS